MGKWNMKGIISKEEEIIEKLGRWNTEILGITETKKKGRGIDKIHKGY